MCSSKTWCRCVLISDAHKEKELQLPSQYYIVTAQQKEGASKQVPAWNTCTNALWVPPFGLQCSFSSSQTASSSHRLRPKESSTNNAKKWSKGKCHRQRQRYNWNSKPGKGLGHKLSHARQRQRWWESDNDLQYMIADVSTAILLSSLACHSSGETVSS